MRKHRWYPRPHQREDAVTPEMHAAIVKRDVDCVAPRVDPDAGPCWGYRRIEHVKEEPRMGKRGSLLVLLCQGHTEDGMKAGFVWCTAAVNRQRMRDHVASFDA